MEHEVKKQPVTPEPKSQRKVFETFREIGDYQINSLKQDAPSCFNGVVSVKRYRVIIEEIDEPDDAIRERIQKLWDECNNLHHHGPLQAIAKRYGLELSFGKH